MFQAAELYQNTAFSTREAQLALWPEPTPETAEANKSAYVRLRQLMNELHKPDDEHFSFGRRCAARRFWRRGLTAGGAGLRAGERLRLQRRAADGGAWFLPTVLVGWLVLTGYFAWLEVLHAGEKTTLEALGLSFSNTFGFLGFNRLYFGVEYWKDFPGILKVMGAAQTVLGVVFLFFFGLGLRNRFRLK